MTNSKTEQIEIRAFTKELNRVWQAFKNCTDSNFESTKGTFLAVLHGLDKLPAEMRTEIMKGWRE